VGLLFKNNAETTLSGGINDSVTTISVASAAVFPTPDANNVFFATLDDGTNVETVKVTGISSNDLTVVREQDNTSAAAFSTGTKIELRLNAKVLDMGTASLTDLDGDTKIQVEESADEDIIRFDVGGSEKATLNSSGVLDVDGGITVDNITIDGTEIDLSSGDLTLDVAGDIILDADGGFVNFKDGGTLIGYFENSSNNFVIRSSVSDADMIFTGTDGGSGITALTLDMSEEGDATFNNNIKFGDNGKALFGAGLDLALYSDGTNGLIESGGDLTLDVSGDITLDAGGEHIRFYDDGNEWGNIESGSSNFNLTASVQDKDFVFLGNDGGSGIIAARIDMSDAGALICNGNVTAFGSTSDIRLKENVEVIPDALDKVKQLKGITFNYKKDGKKSTGLIAQDLEKVLPEAVYETSDVDDEDKHLAIRYGNTVGLLVEAIKEQQEQIETLTAKVKELEGK